MDEIRPFTEDHLEASANLYMRAGIGRRPPAPEGLKLAFRETFLQNPWASPDIPPLVYIENGTLVGFIGVIPRTMEFRGRPILAATITTWLADRDRPRGLAGMKLLRQVLNGPQEFSYVDGASNEASTIYQALGARICSVYSFNWFRLLRPFQTARSLFDRFGGIFPALKGAAGLATAPLDFILSRALPMLRPPHSSLVAQPAAAAELLECIRAAPGREAIRPAYNMPSFNWLISQASNRPGGSFLRSVVVRDTDGARCGWFVYYAPPGCPAYVLSIGACRRSGFGDVLAALFQDAWAQGCSAVKGQAIPLYLTTLTEYYCLFRQPFSCVIGYSRNTEILSAFQAGDMALTRLDAGSWLRLGHEARAASSC